DRILDAQRDRRWIQNELSDDWPWMLYGQKMTIVGFATIVVEVARRAQAFGMSVTGVRRRATEPRPSFVDRVFGSDQLNEALAGSDGLVLSAPGVASTQRMIGAEQLALLNDGAVVVNVARGQIIDEGGLRNALASGKLRGAALG